MRRMRSALLGSTLVMALAVTAPAEADVTLGSTAVPSGSNPAACNTDAVIAQAGEDPGTPYRAPGAGRITQWQTNTSLSGAGAPVAFVVLRPAGPPLQSVVGVDARNLPNPLPAGGVATFSLPAPIAVLPGDTLGLYTDGAAAVCYWWGGAVPAAANLMGLAAPTFPSAGQALTPAAVNSPPGYTLNVAANFAPKRAKKKCKKKKKGKKSATDFAKKKKCKKKKKK